MRTQLQNFVFIQIIRYLKAGTRKKLIKGLSVLNFSIISFCLLSICIFWGAPLLSQNLPYPAFHPGAVSSGNAYTAQVNDGSGLFWNPAGLGAVYRKEFSLSVVYGQMIQWQGQNILPPSFWMVVPSRNRGSFALSALSAYRLGGLYSILGAGIGRRLSKFFRLGGSLFYTSRWLNQHPSVTACFGFVFVANPRLRLAAKIRHILPISPEDTLASQYAAWFYRNTAGLALNVKSFLFSADYDWSYRWIHMGLTAKNRFFALGAGSSFHLPFAKRETGTEASPLYHVGAEIRRFLPIRFAAVFNKKGEQKAVFFGVRLQFGKITPHVSLTKRMVRLEPFRFSGLDLNLIPKEIPEITEQITIYPESIARLRAFLQRFSAIIPAEYQSLDNVLFKNGFSSPEDFRPGCAIQLPLRFNSVTGQPGNEDDGSLKGLFYRAYALKPDYGTVSWNMYSILLASGVEKEEEKWRERMLESNSARPELYNALAISYVLRGEIDFAISLAQNVLRMDSLNATARTILAYALTKKGKFREALQHLERTKTLGDSSLFAQYLIYLCCRNLPGVREKHPEILTGNPFTEIGFPPEKISSGADVRLDLERTFLCTFVEPKTMRHAPPANQFPHNVGRVYCFVTLKGEIKQPSRILPRWYFEDQLIFESKKGWRISPRKRTYGWKTILPNQIGPWKVELYLNDFNTYLGTLHFQIVER